MRDWRSRSVRRLLRRNGERSPLPFNLADSASPRWEERAETAVALLAANAENLRWDRSVGLRIADFGAGNERLQRVLASRLRQPHRYAAFDLHPQSERVVELDVTRELPNDDFDVVFCLGLLEYVEPLRPFLAKLGERYSALLISYTLFDAPHPLTRRERRKRGWLTDYTRAELQRELESLGFETRGFRLTNQERTGVWLVVGPSSA